MGCGGPAPPPPEGAGPLGGEAAAPSPAPSVSSGEAAPAPAAAAGAGPDAPYGQAGAVAGRVRFSGQAPQRARVQVTKDQEVCGAHPILQEDLRVGPNGGLENVVVSLSGAAAPGGPNPAASGGAAASAATPGATAAPQSLASAAEIRQKGCVFRPHVSLVPAGRPVAVYNDDGILHNIHTFSTLNPSFNKAQPRYLKRIDVQFDRAETIRVACDAHPWMSAWIVVTDHPHVALSDAGGAFRIDGVPPGTYTARLWHEKLGERSQPVTVGAGHTADLSVEFR